MNIDFTTPSGNVLAFALVVGVPLALFVCIAFGRSLYLDHKKKRQHSGISG